MSSLQLYTCTIPVGATLLIFAVFLYLAIAGTINPDYYAPVWYIPSRLIPGALLFVAVGFVMPRVVFSLGAVPVLRDVLGVMPNGIPIGIFIGIVSVAASVITWFIYAAVRPREERRREKEESFRRGGDDD